MNKLWKVFSIVLLSSMLIFIFTACGGEIGDQEEGIEEEDSASEDSKDDNNEEIDEPVDENEGEESTEEEEAMDPNEFQGNHFTSEVEEDQAISNWIESKKYESGIHRYPDDENLYMIAAGERNTGGYSIRITEEKLNGEDLILYYKIHSPGPDDIVTQAITYPYLLIEIAEEVEEVDFIEQ